MRERPSWHGTLLRRLREPSPGEGSPENPRARPERTRGDHQYCSRSWTGPCCAYSRFGLRSGPNAECNVRGGGESTQAASAPSPPGSRNPPSLEPSLTCPNGHASQSPDHLFCPRCGADLTVGKADGSSNVPADPGRRVHTEARPATQPRPPSVERALPQSSEAEARAPGRAPVAGSSPPGRGAGRGFRSGLLWTLVILIGGATLGVAALVWALINDANDGSLRSAQPSGSGIAPTATAASTTEQKPTSSPAPPTETSTPEPVYVVQPGDSWWAIADKLGVSMESLLAANGLGDPVAIDPGDVLRLPGGSSLDSTDSQSPIPSSSTVVSVPPSPFAASTAVPTPTAAVTATVGAPLSPTGAPTAKTSRTAGHPTSTTATASPTRRPATATVSPTARPATPTAAASPTRRLATPRATASPGSSFSDGTYSVPARVPLGTYRNDGSGLCFVYKNGSTVDYGSGQFLVQVDASWSVFRSTGCGTWSLATSAGPLTSFPDGAYFVPGEVPPGAYRNNGSGLCFIYKYGSTVDYGSGHFLVQVDARWSIFRSNGCGTWSRQ